MKKYTIIGYATDFGQMKNERTGRLEDWKSKRIIAQELNISDSGVALSGYTKSFKADKTFREVPIGTTGIIYFDSDGRAIEFRSTSGGGK